MVDRDGTKRGRGTVGPALRGFAAFRTVSPPVVLVLAVTALVAIAAHGLRLVLPPSDPGPGWIRVIRIVGTLAVAAGLVGLLIARRRLRAEGERSPDPTVVALRTAATIMGMLAVAALLVHPLGGARPDRAAPTSSRKAAMHPDGRGSVRFIPGLSGRGGGIRSSGTGSGGGEAGAGGGGGGLSLPSTQGGAQESLLARLLHMIPLVLLIAVILMSLLALRGLPIEEPEVLPLGVWFPPEEAEATLEASLMEVERPHGKPRDQITAAYHRLLAALADADAPRRPQEAPHEHLHRVLGPLGIRPEPLHRLAGLYVLAHFSERPVTDEHRAAAAAALAASLDDLRAMSGPLRESVGPRAGA